MLHFISTWLAPLFVPICRLIVDWSRGFSMPALGSYRWRLVPYDVIPFWLANLLVPIWKSPKKKTAKTLSVFLQGDQKARDQREQNYTYLILYILFTIVCSTLSPYARHIFSATVSCFCWTYLLNIFPLVLKIIQKHRLTWRPITLRPSFSFSGANLRCCFSAYFTPMSDLVWTPLDLACTK